MANEEVIGELSVLWNKAESEDAKNALEIAIDLVVQKIKREKEQYEF